MAIVSEPQEAYLIRVIGLTKEQINDMLPSEIDAYCDKVMKDKKAAREALTQKT